MRRTTILFIATILVACSNQNKDQGQSESDKDSTVKSIQTDNLDKGFVKSVYDNPDSDVKLNQSRLKELSDSNVFTSVHSKLFETLTKNHQAFFKSRPDYQLLCIASGDLFQNNTKSSLFIVYDNKNVRISILTFNESTKKYSELYRETKVVNGLKDANCNYSAFGTLDYQFANELIYQRDYLIKKPEQFLEYQRCKIIDISKDKDMILEDGCFSKSFKPADYTKSLCLSTSFVYNNWECLSYDKSIDTFVIFYGQAFAD